MKLAEALLLRADMQRKLAKLRGRIEKYALVDQGDEPAEDPNVLLRQALGVSDDLRSLIVRINRTNVVAKVKDGRTLMEAIAEREALNANHRTLADAVGALGRKTEPYSAREIKRVAVLDAAKLEKQAEDVARKIRELNALIQEANWRIDLEE